MQWIGACDKAICSSTSNSTSHFLHTVSVGLSTQLTDRICEIHCQILVPSHNRVSRGTTVARIGSNAAAYQFLEHSIHIVRG